MSKARVMVTGHSLGGFIAQIIAAENGLRAVTFNALGARNYKKSKENKGIRNIVRKNDIVGRFGKHLGREIVYGNVNFSIKKDLCKGGAPYLLRNHGIGDFIVTLRRRGC